MQKILKSIFFLAILWIGIKSFLFQFCKIPSSSMRPTLSEGDIVFLNKFAYGARIPFTPLSISMFGKNKYLDFIALPYYRVPGFMNIQRGDILAFNHPDENEPIDMKTQVVKRCAAIPGDSILINAGRVYVNNKPFNDSNYAYRCYLFKDSIRYLTEKQNIESKKKFGTGSLQAYPASFYSPHTFPHHYTCKWNNDNFGPYFVPGKGDSVQLTIQNLALYQSLIEKHEHNSLVILSDLIFINGKIKKYYVFKYDYYFVLGDNRNNSIDSRYWGLLPETHLIGKIGYSF